MILWDWQQLLEVGKISPCPSMVAQTAYREILRMGNGLHHGLIWKEAVLLGL